MMEEEGVFYDGHDPERQTNTGQYLQPPTARRCRWLGIDFDWDLVRQRFSCCKTGSALNRRTQDCVIYQGNLDLAADILLPTPLFIDDPLVVPRPTFRPRSPCARTANSMRPKSSEGGVPSQSNWCASSSYTSSAVQPAFLLSQ